MRELRGRRSAPFVDLMRISVRRQIALLFVVRPISTLKPEDPALAEHGHRSSPEPMSILMRVRQFDVGR
jgi:hypothetical protein